MKHSTVRLSFDVPTQEHTQLKMECAEARIAMKDFLHDLVLRGIYELREKKLQERLKKSVQQSKEGRIKSRGSFIKYVEDEI